MLCDVVPYAGAKRQKEGPGISAVSADFLSGIPEASYDAAVYNQRGVYVYGVSYF